MTESTSPVFYAPAADPEMDAATKKARATFKYLWRELTWEYRRIVPTLDLAVVKAAFTDEGGGPDDAEHMWLSDIAFDGDTLQATLLNDPNRLRSVKAGDRIPLALDRIEDWMYVMNGRAFGGFTVQVLRARMSTAERRGHDEAWGFDFGDPAQVALVPDWNAPGKPGLLGRLFGKVASRSQASDPDAEHPMSENMAEGLAEAVEQNRAAFLEQGDEHGLTTLHSLALGGSAACVRVLLQMGADPTRRTRSGRTARDLAEQMGWTRVVALLPDPASRDAP